MRNLDIDNFIKIVIGLVMFNNIEHISSVHYLYAQKVFPIINNFDILNKLHSILVVVIIELSIIVFALKGNKLWTLLFTFCIFILSLIYYNVLDQFHFMNFQEIISKIILSLIFTVSIYIFSEMFAKSEKDKADLSSTGAEITNRKAYLKQLSKELDDTREQTIIEKAYYKKYKAEFELLKAEQVDWESLKIEFEKKKAELENEKAELEQELTCDICNDFIGKSLKSLNAHKGICKNKL